VGAAPGTVLAGAARAEAVQVLANMAVGVLEGGGGGERGSENRWRPSGSTGGGVSAAVVDGAGARAHRVDNAPVRAGRGGVRLGWAREAVVVIDTDLGVSGRWGVARAGFAELVARVCTGEVGAIFGLEISRLARSNAEVARLMEFAAITETLLIDADGVYDPTDVNDRMRATPMTVW
jgi:hypothetical protein